MRRFKLAVVRAVHDGSSPSADEFIDFVMTDPQSVLNYWTQTTNGWFDFTDSALFPWVNITVAPTATDRYSTASAAIAAVRSANPGHDPLAGFDGALVLLYPGIGDVANPDAGKPGQPALLTKTGFAAGSGQIGGLRFSLIATTPADHTFACHELGHTLGADHTFGVLCSGIDYNDSGAVGPEYGSPYDLMSSATFGDRTNGKKGKAKALLYGANPTFNHTGTGAGKWVGAKSMGPALSRADLHHWFPDSMTGSTHEAPFPDPGTSHSYRIARASSESAYTLLLFHPADEAASGAGRVYVEYRPADGWDRGLGGPGSGLARAGVVVHTLEDVATGPRVWYRGSIADDDPDTDLRLDTRPLIVAVTARGGDGEHWVELTVTTGTTQTAGLTVENTDTVEHGTVAQERQTPCGDPVLIGTWYTVTTGVCRVATTGLEPDATAPAVSVDWRAGGTLIPATGAVMNVPSVDGTLRHITCSIDPGTHELAIVSLPGETYTIEVRASAATSNPAVGTTARIEAVATFTPPGSFNGLSPDSITALGRCWAQQAHELHLRQTFDVASLLDHHEVWQWQQDANTLQELLAVGDDPLVAEFRRGMGLATNGFEVPNWRVPDVFVFPG